MDMTPTERKAWQQALDVVDALLDLPADQRARHLVELGLAANVHMHVRSLLAAHEDHDGVLDRPCAGALAPVRDALAGHRPGR